MSTSPDVKSEALRKSVMLNANESKFRKMSNLVSVNITGDENSLVTAMDDGAVSKDIFMLEIDNLGKKYNEETIIKAARNQNVQVISCHIDRNNTTQEPDGKAHLRIRGTEGDKDMVEYIIKHDFGADIKKKDCKIKKNNDMNNNELCTPDQQKKGPSIFSKIESGAERNHRMLASNFDIFGNHELKEEYANEKVPNPNS